MIVDAQLARVHTLPFAKRLLTNKIKHSTEIEEIPMRIAKISCALPRPP